MRTKAWWNWKKCSTSIEEGCMAIEAPFPELDEFLSVIGEAGHRLSEIEAIEGAAGNISVYIGWPIEPRRQFPIVETIDLPQAVARAGRQVVSGHRLRAAPARDHPGPGGQPRLCGGERRWHDGAAVHVAAPSVCPADQRVQLAPGRASRSGPRDRHQFSRGDSRPAAAPDLSQPYPALSERAISEPPPPALAAGD